ncbi:transcription factor HBP-1b(c38)-like isoform X3 [Gossypium australe]|uniref:Transcription factor HBP-1b(C38)-like isoform X3 n=1 Tax=Gossypium australe TaxID=47621 RepID=A0A5B6X615_9ROSI|nr:transcription factor HBP-1b(c38)-like isoform X3 [Gossypium australe]
MQSFKAAAPNTTPDMFCHSSFFLRVDDDFNPANAFHHDDSVDLSSSSIFSLKSSNVDVVGNSLHYDAFNTGIRAAEIVSSGTGCLDTGQFMYQKGTTLGNGHIENWGDSGLADNSQQTDTSTDVDTDDKNQVLSLCFFNVQVLKIMFCSKSFAKGVAVETRGTS